jgi:serine/threonine protein kinase
MFWKLPDKCFPGWKQRTPNGIIHRDIKPGKRHSASRWRRQDSRLRNRQVAGEVRAGKSLDDFPIVRTETGLGVMLGTIGYMSPEQVRGLAVDVRTDVWSCGVVLYEMLGGQRPFDGQTNADTLVTMLEREPEPLFRTGAQTPAALRQIQFVIDKALSKQPERRYQTAAEMRSSLEQIKTTLEAKNTPATVRSVRGRR